MAAPTTPGVPRPGGAALTAGRRALTAGDEAIAPATAGYVNNNPAATAREVQVGTILDEQAQTGALRDVARVEGMPESKTARRADYDFVMADGSRITADLYEPGTAQPRAVGSMMVKKSGQATAMVVDLKGGSASMPIPDLVEEIRGKLGTPGLSIDRVVVVRDGAIIVDLTR